MSTKRMPPTRHTKETEVPNRKAMIWTGSIAVFIIIVISVLLIVYK